MWQLSVVVLQVRLLYQNCHGVPSLGPFLYFLQTTSISNQENQRKIPLVPKASKLEAQAWVLQTAWVVFSTRDKVNKSFRPQASVLPAAWLLIPGKHNIDLPRSTVLCDRVATQA